MRWRGFISLYVFLFFIATCLQLFRLAVWTNDSQSSAASVLDAGNLIDSTLVTAYFDIPSKHSSDHYAKWMTNLLSVQDNIIVFTDKYSRKRVVEYAASTKENIVFIQLELNETHIAEMFNLIPDFWIRQFSIDPEQSIHRDYRLYWIWHEKTTFLKKAKDMNPYNSEFFAWIDIGYLREDKYTGKQLITGIPRDFRTDQVMMLDVSHIIPGFVGGGFIGGFADGIDRWYNLYYKIIWENRGQFIGTDQPWMRKSCDVEPDMCYLVTPRNDGGDEWFYMATFLHSQHKVSVVSG